MGNRPSPKSKPTKAAADAVPQVLEALRETGEINDDAPESTETAANVGIHTGAEASFMTPQRPDTTLTETEKILNCTPSPMTTTLIFH